MSEEWNWEADSGTTQTFKNVLHGLLRGDGKKFISVVQVQSNLWRIRYRWSNGVITSVNVPREFIMEQRHTLIEGELRRQAVRLRKPAF